MEDPSSWINLAEVQAVAHKKMTKPAYDYYASGAEDEIALREAQMAFKRIRFLPKMLQGLPEKCDTKVKVLGGRYTLSSPLIVPPMAMQKLAHPDGEIGACRAAKMHGVSYCLSTMATTKIEDVASAHSSTVVPPSEGESLSSLKMFQLYVYKDRRVSESLIRRAEAAGFQALVITVDLPPLGHREADIRNRFHLPAPLRLENFIGESTTTEIDKKGASSGLADHSQAHFDSTLDWSIVPWLRSVTTLPIVVKGILRADDALMARQHRVDAVWVSNHGGRQLDCTIAPIDALPEVVSALEGSGIDAWLDGGVRRGTDVVKALALGAKLVGVGRPVLWGLAAGGEKGVSRVLSMLKEELGTSLQLAGAPSVRDLSPDFLVMPGMTPFCRPSSQGGGGRRGIVGSRL